MEENASDATCTASTGYQVDDLIVDVGQQRVTRAGTDIPLPHLSFKLLVTLARAAPIWSPSMSLQSVFGQAWSLIASGDATSSSSYQLPHGFDAREIYTASTRSGAFSRLP